MICTDLRAFFDRIMGHGSWDGSEKVHLSNYLDREGHQFAKVTLRLKGIQLESSPFRGTTSPHCRGGSPDFWVVGLAGVAIANSQALMFISDTLSCRSSCGWPQVREDHVPNIHK